MFVARLFQVVYGLVCLSPTTPDGHMPKTLPFHQCGIMRKVKNSGLLNASVALTCVALIFAVANEAFAHSGTQEEQDACTPDVFRFCSAQIPNEDRIVACLNRHLAKLSPACRSVMSGEPASKKSRGTR